MEEMKKNKIMPIMVLSLILVFGMYGYILYDKVFADNKTTVTTDVSQNKEKTTITRIGFDTNKCLNEEGNTYDVASYSSDGFGLDIKVNSDKKSANLYINWDLFGKLVSVSKSGIQEYAINNFSKEIEDIYVANFGSGIGGATIIYLMNDGTLEYTPIVKANATGEFKSYGKINGVSNVVRILTANRNGADGKVERTTLAQQLNGSFYDLLNPLSTTGNY